ncbi:hypothetical protein [Gilvimarinus agarilyticus]|uniref:hypothetical protein n=1 Tax=Gilvimarinus agarilyticus TaxID=679259 RepID=UPI0012FAD13A|nr:hypothetical protein [Gilvimarinus agarilyticus]
MTAEKLEAAKRDNHALRNDLQALHFRLDRQTQLANSLASEVEQLKARLEKECKTDA